MTASTRAFIVLGVLAAALGGCSDSPGPGGPYSQIETFVGNGLQGAAVDGGSPRETPLYWPQDISFAPDGRAYVVDWNNYRIRKIENGIITTIIGSGNPVPDGESEAPTGIATEVDLNHMTHVSFDPAGNILLSGFHSSAVFHYDFASNLVSPVCGNGARTYGGDGGPAANALVNLPVCTHYDSEGNLFLMDQANQRLRVIDTSGTITTFAGTGVPGFSGDGGPPAEAQINLPVGQQAWPAGKFVIGAEDRIYIADTSNNRIRMIEHNEDPVPAALQPSHGNDIITTVAGNGQKGFGGDGGAAIDAKLNLPGAVAVDADGNLYISDTYNHCIRKVDTQGIITTFAGHPGVRVPPSGKSIGDGGHPLDAYLDRPAGITFDADGNFYVADLGNNRIRMIKKNP